MGWAEAAFHSGQRYGLEAAWAVPIRAAGIIFQEADQDSAVAAGSVASAVEVSVVVVPAEAGKTGVLYFIAMYIPPYQVIDSEKQ